MKPSTGIPSLDTVLGQLCPGDNVVWQVNAIDDYHSVVKPFVANARSQGDKLVYFRFARHSQLVQGGDGVEICTLKPEQGFEKFITEVHDVIRKTGPGGYYVFDSLSELVLESYSERMLGNFFMLTCPFLRELETIAYFAVIKNYHSYYAALPISQTTQLLLDVYRREGNIYIHPLKVDGRYSPTMNMLHIWDDDKLTPIPDSTTITDVVTSTPWPGLQSASYRMVGMWDRRFMQGEDILNTDPDSTSSAKEQNKIATDTFHSLLRQIISRDNNILKLAEKYFTMADLIHIWKRMIGSGLVGGKAVGMLLARAILNKTDPQWSQFIEAHDSFYVGSDIFYTFLVENQCWDIREKQKDPATFLDDAAQARELITTGNFPDYIVKRFSDMLDYFGQSPIIVRSSSLLEDAFGNAFAGKYDSVFCANQGTPDQRLEEFIKAVKIVYSSTMSENALTYRAQKKVLDRDEQMALLVQRVSGAPYGQRFFPQVAGVGFSYNPYVWSKSIDPEAGMLRLVFGLGTRAVDRHDDDYARLVALNAPTKRPESNIDDQLRHSQRSV
ncbi:MAG TPA: pyruvate, phosphate dikinase, partial [Phycisphaerae bacterium]|nr:pyruvate, phosphate dikinase [Phycisphaerae bacterium]